MKKVLVINNNIRGIQNFREEILSGLKDEGYELHVAVPQECLENSSYSLLGEFKFHNIDLDRNSKNIYKELKTIVSIYKLVKKIKPNYILSYTIKPNMYTGIVMKMIPLSNIIFLPNITGLGQMIMDENSFFSRLWLKLYKWSIKKAKVVFVQNREIERLLKDRNYKTKLLPGSGVNLRKIEYSPVSISDTITISYIGRIMRNKGSLELINAIGKFTTIETKNQYVFNFIGDVVDSELKKKLVEVDSYVTHIPYTEEVERYMQKSTFVINPSYHEGMSNVLLEAAAVGRPLLASNIYGCKEIVSNDNGFLFESRSSDAIFEILKKLDTLSMEEIREMGLKSRELVEEKFNRDNVLNAYVEVMKGE